MFLKTFRLGALVTVLGVSAVVHAAPDGGVDAAPGECLDHPCAAIGTLKGEIDPSSALSLADFYNRAQKSKVDAAILVIDSPGGHFTSAGAMIRIIESAPFPTFCVVNGQAASAAFWLLQACKDRAATPSSLLMIHEAALYQEFGPCQKMTARQLEKHASELRAMDAVIARYVAPRMGLKMDFYVSKTQDSDWDMDVTAGLKFHAIDREILTVDAYLQYLASLPFKKAK